MHLCSSGTKVWGGQNWKSKNNFNVHFFFVNQSLIVELSTSAVMKTFDN